MKLLFIIIIPLLIAISVFWIKYRPSEKIEYRNSNYLFKTYSDIDDGGNSTVYGNVIDKEYLELTYKLSDKADYPNISLEFTKPNFKLMDFSGYDNIELNIESQLSRFLVLQFYLYIDGFSNKNDYKTYLPIAYYLELGKEDNRYSIPLDQFKPHTWWISKYQISEEMVKGFTFDSVVSMDIMNDPSFPTGTEDKILFKYVKLYSSLKGITLFIGILLLFYYLVYFTYLLVLNKIDKVKENREEIVLVPYKSFDLSKDDSEEKIIENYICSHYNDPLLNIGKVESETCISERVISKVLKEKYNYSFPGFINFLRVSEAKKLLLTSDKKILDIAMMVGYNSLGHFNRTFKKHENHTPREFRKINLKC